MGPGEGLQDALHQVGAREEVPGAHEVLVLVVRGEEELAQKAGVEGVDHEVSEVVLWVPLEQDGDVVQLGQDVVVGLQEQGGEHQERGVAAAVG